ncbi:MAG: hypothetical protein Q7S87_07260 [Agitococcus sp.]|nr:hypothetical protein [Agitococcus sp.]
MFDGELTRLSALKDSRLVISLDGLFFAHITPTIIMLKIKRKTLKQQIPQIATNKVLFME